MKTKLLLIFVLIGFLGLAQEKGTLSNPGVNINHLYIHKVENNISNYEYVHIPSVQLNRDTAIITATLIGTNFKTQFYCIYEEFLHDNIWKFSFYVIGYTNSSGQFTSGYWSAIRQTTYNEKGKLYLWSSEIFY